MNLFKKLQWLLPALLLMALTGCGSGSSGVAAPAQPAAVTVAAGTGETTLSWSAVTGATSYNVYYSATTGVTKANATNSVTNLPTPNCTVSGLLNGTAYYFVVSAVNGSGESIASSEVTVTPLAKPQGITVTAGDGQATVSWSAAAGATSYNIYYGTAAGVTTSGVKVANAVSPQVVTGLANNTTYYFVVTAVNAGGESIVSSEKSATPSVAPQLPPNPTGTAVSSSGVGQVTVSWNPVVGATSYTVYYLNSSATETKANVIANGVSQSVAGTSAIISGLTVGDTYWFEVTATNAVGEGDGQPNPKSFVIQ
jgi:fibronectin type 3 domain-containing protein